MNVAFYYRNSGIRTVDCTNIQSGNPGIGGTHFAMLQLVSALSSTDLDINCFLFAESIEGLPKNINIVKVQAEAQLPETISHYNIDIFVANKTTDISFSKKTLNILESTGVRIIIWAHVFMKSSFVNLLSNSNCIKRVVAVGKNQLFTFCDHPIYRKSTYIYNICNFSHIDYNFNKERKHNVVYIGAINYIKGVHLLLKAWPKVLKEIPDANLYIIGGGNLYSRYDKLGEKNITEKNYERRCLKYVLDQNGAIIPSVHFLGVLGNEKWDIMKQCKVGIVNTHYWETFGYTAIEMQLAGLKIVSFKSPGLLDTIYEGNSILYDSPSLLSVSIIDALLSVDNNAKEAVQYVRETFDTKEIIRKWTELLHDVYNGKDNETITVNSNLPFINKQLRNQRIKRWLHLPSLLFFREKYINTRWFLFNISQPSKVYDKILSLIK